jgi:hypothetical protein
MPPAGMTIKAPARAMIAVPAKAATRNYPQMSQMKKVYPTTMTSTIPVFS